MGGQGLVRAERASAARGGLTPAPAGRRSSSECPQSQVFVVDEVGGTCSAGGEYKDGSGRSQALVVNEVGGTWKAAIEVPGSAALNKGGFARVYSLSCSSPGNCSAGGFYEDRSGHWQARAPRRPRFRPIRVRIRPPLRRSERTGDAPGAAPYRWSSLGVSPRMHLQRGGTAADGPALGKSRLPRSPRILLAPLAE